MKNIVLIGMPGCGKSTCGVVLAKAIGYDFEDTDLIISKLDGRKLQDIIDTDGVDKFIELEEQVGTNIECSKTVIATGGSMVLSSKAMQHLKSIATIIYLKVPYEVLLKRIHNFKSRGIVFRNGESFEDIYKSRTPLYEKYADITVEFNDADVESVIENIVNLLSF